MDKDQTRAIRIAWILLIGAGVAVYANSLSGPFIFDDEPAIVESAGYSD